MTAITINLKKASPIEVPLYLYQAQLRVNKLWDLNFALIDGKDGWIRSNVLGGQWNYTGRNVIVLDPTLKMDEVDIPYKSFIVMFSGKIIRRIKKEKGWSTVKAYNFVKVRFKFDPYIYKIMEDIIREEEPKIILNRNPKPVGVVKSC